MALLICPDCHEKPDSAALLRSAKPLYCPVCFDCTDGLHVKLPCCHTLCIGHYKMMGGEVDEMQEANAVKEVAAANKGAGLSAQARRRAAKEEKKSSDKKVAEPSSSSFSLSKAAKKDEAAAGEKWFPTHKSEKDGRILDSTMRAIMFCMLICGLSNSYLGSNWLQDAVQNAPQKLTSLPSVLQKSGLSMLADVLTGDSEGSHSPVTFKTAADGDLAVAEGDAVHVHSPGLDTESVSTAHELADEL